MNEITNKIQEVMKRSEYKARTMSMIHLPEVQGAEGIIRY